jgi:uncharacterized protein (TIGR02453 family)
MRVSVRAAVLIACVCLSGTLLSQSLLVLSKRDHTLAIVDAATLQVVAKVPSGNDPHEVIASTDGKTAYISNYGFGAYKTLTPVDLVAHKALPVIDLGALRGPHGLTFAGGKVWFTAEAAKALGRYDPVSRKIDLVLGTGQDRTHMIYVSPDGQSIVTTNVSSATVSIIDQEPLRMPGPPPGANPSANPAPGMTGGGRPPGPPMPRTDWRQTVVPVGHGSEGFDVSPDGKEIWVANAQDGTISIVGFREKNLIQTVAANVPGANRLKFTPDGTLVLVSSGPSLVVLDARTRWEVKRIAIGHGSAGILVEPDGARAFVACGPDNYVAVIDLHSLAVTGHIEAGGEPDGLAWAAPLKFLRGLKRNNDRAWFDQRKPIYERAIKAPMLALIGEINHALLDFAPEYARPPQKAMMRIYRDIRFSSDKRPYKSNIAAWWARAGLEKTSGGGFYFELNATSVAIAAGVYMPEREQLLAIRRYLSATGGNHHAELRKLLADKKLNAALRPFDGLKLTRAPKGFEPEDPAIDLLLCRQWGVSASLPAEEALKPGFAKQIVDRFKRALPLVTLLNAPLLGKPSAAPEAVSAAAMNRSLFGLPKL